MSGFVEASAFMRSAIKTLHVSSPRSTAMGILFGVVIDALVRGFSAKIKLMFNFDVASLSVLHPIAASVLFFNLPDYLRRDKLPKRFAEAHKYIADVRDSGAYSDKEIKKMYDELNKRALKELVDINVVRRKNVDLDTPEKN